MLKAHEALQLGFISRLVDVDVFRQQTESIALQITEKAPMALRLAKQCIQRQAEIPIEVGMLLENLSQSYLFTTNDKNEGVTSFIEKRNPVFSGK